MTRQGPDDDGRKLCDAGKEFEPERQERPLKPWRVTDRRKRRQVLAQIDALLESRRH